MFDGAQHSFLYLVFWSFSSNLHMKLWFARILCCVWGGEQRSPGNIVANGAKKAVFQFQINFPTKPPQSKMGGGGVRGIKYCSLAQQGSHLAELRRRWTCRRPPRSGSRAEPRRTAGCRPAPVGAHSGESCSRTGWAGRPQRCSRCLPESAAKKQTKKPPTFSTSLKQHCHTCRCGSL